MNQSITKFLLSTAFASTLGVNSFAGDMVVRVTFYNPQDCPWGSRTATGRRAVEGVTCAVDPKIIPWGSIIEANELKAINKTGRFIAHDTGSAVKSRKASRRWGKKCPVIDIYISDRKRAKHFAKTLPMFMKVKVYDK